ncbi:MAG TPA: hypothetical protein VFY32_16510, partial [Solirubrobacteraceae bacterium]|nr:hypothetical protein [Solirubrobacteraceae bacterium]
LRAYPVDTRLGMVVPSPAIADQLPNAPCTFIGYGFAYVFGCGLLALGGRRLRAGHVIRCSPPETVATWDAGPASLPDVRQT